VEIPERPFPRIPFAQAASILEREYSIIVGPDDDMSSEGERCLAEYARREYGHDFLFITGYPSAVRAFYTMREESDPRISKSFDLLYRGLEITSGAQREHRYDTLRAQILDKGMRPEDFEHYLACFRHGIPPHGGLGF
jgi:aspartyl/asparaginyl-tRNA synthetase